MVPPAQSAADAGAGHSSPTERNLADLVTAAAQRDAVHPALLDLPSGRTVSWGALDAAVDAAAGSLRASGMADGRRVVVRLETSPEFCVAVFAVLRAGAVVVPVGTGVSERELDTVVEHSGASGLVAGPGDDVARDVAARHGVSTVEPPSPVATPDAGPTVAAGGGEDLAVLAYTSGTSGRPRGAMLPHRALLANLEQGAAMRPAPMTAADRVLLTLPLFHSYGFAGLLRVAHAAATAILAERFEAEPVLAAVRSQRVTIVIGVPPMYRAWLRLQPERLAGDLATVRLFTSGAAPLEPASLAGMRAATGLDVFEGYGLTETGPVLTSTRLDGTAKPGSVGRPLPGSPTAGVGPVELRLVDSDGRPLPMDGDDDFGDADFGEEAADTGEVVVRGPNLFAGYWPDGVHGPAEVAGLGPGWIRTGDIGFLDQDGDLHLVDRADDLIIVNGFNVYPHEVEEVLREHPAVAEAAAVGVPDEHSGEAVRAVVVAVPGQRPDTAELVEHCRSRLARFKVPVHVEVTDLLPRSANRKLVRRRLREG